MNFYDVDADLSAVPVEELDRIAIENGGVVRSIGYGYACRGQVVPSEEWSGRWINRQGMGNHGTLILIPRTTRSRAVWRKGQIRYYEGFGIPYYYASRMVDIRIPYSHEQGVLDALKEILESPVLTSVMRRHPATYGSGSGRSEWRYAYGDVLPDSILHLSAPREASLAQIVQRLVAA
jgi:hypothetical protein